MSKTIEQILGAENLCGVIDGLKGTMAATQLLPTIFLTPNRKVEGNTATYIRTLTNRKTARLAAYGSPSRLRTLKGIEKVPVTLMHTVEHILHEMRVLINLKSYTSDVKQKLGEEEVARKTAEFKQLFQNLRAGAVFSLLSQGAIYFDGEGNLLADSTGAAVTVSFGIPAGNLDQLDALGEGDIISAKWSAAATDIVSQIQNLKQVAVQLSGYPLRHAFYGKDILGFLQGNDVLKIYLQNNQDYQKKIAGGEIPDRLLGLTWHPVCEAYSELEAGGNFWFADDTVVFTAEPDFSWYEVIEGSVAVPTSIEVRSDGSAALKDVVLTFGMFSYALLLSDPVAIKQLAGDTFLPVLKVPKSIFIADVDF